MLRHGGYAEEQAKFPVPMTLALTFGLLTAKTGAWVKKTLSGYKPLSIEGHETNNKLTAPVF